MKVKARKRWTNGQYVVEIEQTLEEYKNQNLLIGAIEILHTKLRRTGSRNPRAFLILCIYLQRNGKCKDKDKVMKKVKIMKLLI